MSYLFTGSTDNIQVGIGGSTSFAIPTTGSLMIWAKPAIDLTGLSCSLFDTRNAGPTRLFGIVLHSDGNIYAGWVPTVGTEDDRVVTSSGFPGNGVLTNFILTWDDTANETKLYVNGTQRGLTVSTLTTYSTAADDLIIGNNAVTGAAPSHCRESYGVFWNRVLTTTEITNLQTCPPATVAASGRVHEWDLLVDALDSVGSNNGTVNGATLDSGEGPSLPCAQIPIWLPQGMTSGYGRDSMIASGMNN